MVDNFLELTRMQKKNVIVIVYLLVLVFSSASYIIATDSCDFCLVATFALASYFCLFCNIVFLLHLAHRWPYLKRALSSTSKAATQNSIYITQSLLNLHLSYCIPSLLPIAHDKTEITLHHESHLRSRLPVILAFPDLPNSFNRGLATNLLLRKKQRFQFIDIHICMLVKGN